jgi:hypothetical protein
MRNTIGANKEKDELLSEIEATNSLLKELQAKAKALHWKNTLSSMERPDGSLHRYRVALEALQAKLVPATTSMGKAAKRAVWHFQREEIEEIISKISRCKDDIRILLNLYFDFDRNKT